MASDIPGVRRVRCPKCRSLLVEPARVPVYQCGGCGALLRAKNRVAALVGGASSGSLESNSQNLPCSSSMNTESMSAVKPAIPGGVERLAGSDLAVSNSSSANNPAQMEECSDGAEKGIEGRGSGDPSHTERFSEPEERIQVEQGHLLDERAEKRVDQSPLDCGSSKSEERVRVKQGQSPDEQTEKSMKPSPQDCDSLRPSDEVDQSPESIANDVAVLEDMKLAAGSSHSYDGSASSPDRSCQDNRLPHKYLLLSRRTFRHKKVLSSTDGMGKDAKVPGQQLPGKSADERVASEIRGSFDSKRDGLPSRPFIPALERDTTSSSEDFHSAQNWIGSETDAGSSDLAVSYSSSANNLDKMEECSDGAIKGIEGRSSGDPSPTERFSKPEERIQVEHEHLSEKRAEKQLNQSPRDCGSSKSEERVRVKQGHSPDEQTGKSMNPSRQDCDRSRPSDKVDQSLESIAIDAAVSEDMKLVAGSSHSYYGSASSPDRSQDNRLPHKYLLLSRRTFRHKKVLNSTDCMGKEAKVPGQQLPGKSADEKVASEIRGSFNSKRDGLPSRPLIPALERDTMFGCEDSHSVQNWIGSETDAGGSKSLPKDLPLPSQNENPSAKIDCLEPDHMKILRKVDELRDELSGFLARTVEGKGAPHFSRGFSRIPISGQPPCSSCLPRPHNMYSQSNLPSHLRKAPAEENTVEKSNGKEKKVPIKSYCRPVSGGSPFVVCYKCWKLLQLPADFLMTRKRLHKLCCGACSEVLVFSFRPKVRMAPMTPSEARHPPSEVETHNDRRVWDPMSFSDNYGVSFARSHSSEAEPVLHASRNSSYSIEGSDGRQVRCGRLHQLMGYTSASELLFQTRGGVDEGYESTEPGTPQFYRPSAEDVRYGLNGTGITTTNYTEIQEEDEPRDRLRMPRRGSALHGLLKKGVRELSQGVESVKQRIHSNG